MFILRLKFPKNINIQFLFDVLLFLVISILFFIFAIFYIPFVNAQEKLLVYENSHIGIQLNYSEKDWSLTKTCDSYESCLVIFNNNVDSSTSFTIYTQSVSQLKNKCNCNSLLDFVQYDYQTTYNQPQITILNDSQIVIGNNISAWQMDYLTNSEMKVLKHIITWASSNQIYYRFSYHSHNEIDKILNDNNELIQSIKFFQPLENNLPSLILEKQPIKKQPSFMTKNTKTNNTFEKLQSQFKNETDSKKHELLVHNNVQFRDTESEVKKDSDIYSAYSKFKDTGKIDLESNTKVYSSTQFRDIDQEVESNSQSIDTESEVKKDSDIYSAYSKFKDTGKIDLELTNNKINTKKSTSNEKKITQPKQIKFNDLNFNEYYFNADSYLFEPVAITGRIFNVIDDSFQIYHLGDSDKNTFIIYDKTFNLREDECVKIEGITFGNMPYKNLFGGSISAPGITGTSVKKIDCIDMVDPNSNIIVLEKTVQKGGIIVTLHKVEFSEKETKAFLTIENTNNGDEESVRFYDTSDSKAFQGKKQFEADYSSSYPDIPSEIPAGIEEKGVVVFEPLSFNTPSKFVFEMSVGYFKDYKFTFIVE